MRGVAHLHSTFKNSLGLLPLQSCLKIRFLWKMGKMRLDLGISIFLAILNHKHKNLLYPIRKLLNCRLKCCFIMNLYSKSYRLNVVNYQIFNISIRSINNLSSIVSKCFLLFSEVHFLFVLVKIPLQNMTHFI